MVDFTESEGGTFCDNSCELAMPQYLAKYPAQSEVFPSPAIIDIAKFRGGLGEKPYAWRVNCLSEIIILT